MKLDIGCGKNKKEGFFGVDIVKFPGVDKVVDLRKRWPWKKNSIEEINCSHFLEHFDAMERAHMVNEAYRVLKPGGTMTVVVPYGLSERAYGDPTHKWPPVVSFWFYYLRKSWRDENAPHTNDIYTCDFTCTWGYSIHPTFVPKSTEAQQFACEHYINAIMDIHATLKKE